MQVPQQWCQITDYPWKENLLQCHFASATRNLSYTTMRLNPDLCIEKPASNSLSYCNIIN